VEHLFIEDIDFKNSSYLVLLEGMFYLEEKVFLRKKD
jgi:hypothetical protein